MTISPVSVGAVAPHNTPADGLSHSDFHIPFLSPTYYSSSFCFCCCKFYLNQNPNLLGPLSTCHWICTNTCTHFFCYEKHIRLPDLLKINRARQPSEPSQSWRGWIIYWQDPPPASPYTHRLLLLHWGPALHQHQHRHLPCSLFEPGPDATCRHPRRKKGGMKTALKNVHVSLLPHISCVTCPCNHWCLGWKGIFGPQTE